MPFNAETGKQGTATTARKISTPGVLSHNPLSLLRISVLTYSAISSKSRMTIFVHIMKESELIRRCVHNDRKAQKELYERYSGALLAVARRYISDSATAEDILVQAMHTILTKIQQYKETGSFYGWMKRIVVNQALMHLRKNQLPIQDLESAHIKEPHLSESALQNLYEAELLSLMDRLPQGYRTVINLYLVEGYKHREIADILGISINTSKSQLALAKKSMIQLLQQKDHPSTQNM